MSRHKTTTSHSAERAGFAASGKEGRADRCEVSQCQPNGKWAWRRAAPVWCSQTGARLHEAAKHSLPVKGTIVENKDHLNRAIRSPGTVVGYFDIRSEKRLLGSGPVGSSSSDTTLAIGRRAPLNDNAPRCRAAAAYATLRLCKPHVERLPASRRYKEKKLTRAVRPTG